MPEQRSPHVAIVDYGLGNLYSINNACLAVGISPIIASSTADLAAADGLVLPGIGAFGDAMAALRQRDLASPIVDHVRAGKPVMGICLGLQLLMSESHEFGVHKGLDLVPGTVENLGAPTDGGRKLKVPHVGWTAVRETGRSWSGTALDGIEEGTHFYFVHSFFVRPADPVAVLSVSRYGDFEFCSSVQLGSVFACQWHPERSAIAGLHVYRNFKRMMTGISAGVEAGSAT